LRSALTRCVVLDYAISVLVAAGLFVYLTFALLRPERF
jgi:K+-transporting ATPase KdpF subunit